MKSHNRSAESHILYESEDSNVLVIDIPESIVNAQGLENEKELCKLISSTPILAPYPAQEPSSARAKDGVRAANEFDPVHAEYGNLLVKALNELSTRFTGPWCLPRVQRQQHEAGAGHKRRYAVMQSSIANLNQLVLKQRPCLRAIDSGLGSNSDVVCDQWPFVQNTAVVSVHLVVDSEHTFLLPPKSTFMLLDLSISQNISAFHTNFRIQADDQDCSRLFDFILLDPPWLNRSVRRKRGAYQTWTMPSLSSMLLRLDLDRLMAHDCLVAIWTTNSTASRQLVLGEGGLFDIWNVQLIEEWIWLKTTVSGEPITTINSTWRKPYEVLLLGRRRRIGQASPVVTIRRRVLLGVPDVHSRKPCLRSLIAGMMPNADNYRALEVFARHLVTGWHSIGDECIKYNDVSHWIQTSRQEHDTLSTNIAPRTDTSPANHNADQGP